jgi:type I restriction enzyme R subunit
MKNAGVIGADSPSPRITSRAAFVDKLAAPAPRLLCALIHKFAVADLQGPPPPVHGRFYVFVDECHRTQGGDMHRQMKRWLADALFIGFTGTPLLRQDRQMTRDVFGTYIDTYKFHQAVADKVVLDLKYEARAVLERLTSRAAIDRWFEQKTQHLNNFQKAILRRRWATMEDLMSAGERKQRLIANIIEDFSLKPRLNNDQGTALLVVASVHDACHYFRLFQNMSFGPCCGIITSFEPNANAISRALAHSDERYKFDTYTRHVLNTVCMAPGTAACGRARAHQAVGGKARRQGQRLLPAAHEDEVGRLQPPERDHSPEHRSGQETRRPAGVRRRTRNAASP